MIALLQRVTEARVEVAGLVKGQIGPGLLAFIGVRPDDDGARAARLLTRLLDYRIFADPAGRMNLSVRDTGGGLLLVPQFTLAAGQLQQFVEQGPRQLGRCRGGEPRAVARACIRRQRELRY